MTEEWQQGEGRKGKLRSGSEFSHAEWSELRLARRVDWVDTPGPRSDETPSDTAVIASNLGFRHQKPPSTSTPPIDLPFGRIMQHHRPSKYHPYRPSRLGQSMILTIAACTYHPMHLLLLHKPGATNILFTHSLVSTLSLLLSSFLSRTYLVCCSSLIAPLCQTDRLLFYIACAFAERGWTSWV